MRLGGPVALAIKTIKDSPPAEVLEQAAIWVDEHEWAPGQLPAVRESLLASLGVIHPDPRHQGVRLESAVGARMSYVIQETANSRAAMGWIMNALFHEAGSFDLEDWVLTQVRDPQDVSELFRRAALRVADPA